MIKSEAARVIYVFPMLHNMRSKTMISGGYSKALDTLNVFYCDDIEIEKGGVL